jgi:hypothetical protein
MASPRRIPVVSDPDGRSLRLLQVIRQNIRTKDKALADWQDAVDECELRREWNDAMVLNIHGLREDVARLEATLTRSRESAAALASRNDQLEATVAGLRERVAELLLETSRGR